LGVIWIIHQQAGVRRALRRLCGVDAAEAIFAGPTDPQLKSSAAPSQIIMGLCGDFEVELDFAQDMLTRFPKTQWLILATPDDLDEAERLFDVLPAEFQLWPPERDLLLATLRSATQRDATPLSTRIANERLEGRFLRWFGDLELPSLERARDPRWWSLPVLVHGEPGTGRRLMARALHSLQSQSVDSALLQLNCREMDLYDIEASLREGVAQHPLRLTIWLDEVDELDASQQETLVHWIEDAPPFPCPLRMRWIATSGDVSSLAASCRLIPDLHNALSGLSLYLPPLRDNAERTTRFIKETMRAFTEEHDQPERQLAPDCMTLLEQDAGRVNLRDL
jgi:DNA-binding NtrC family response regulator